VGGLMTALGDSSKKLTEIPQKNPSKSLISRKGMQRNIKKPLIYETRAATNDPPNKQSSKNKPEITFIQTVKL
jgi:hypothetical protein